MNNIMNDIDFEKITELIYEATRKEQNWSNRRIVPEEWSKRNKNFRDQMINVIKHYYNIGSIPTPEEAHNSWWREYEKMGWKCGKVRDVINKTHPDMIPYEDLPQDEKEKDAIFLTFVWLVFEVININS